MFISIWNDTKSNAATKPFIIHSKDRSLPATWPGSAIKVGIFFLASAAIGFVGGFALMNQGLFRSIGSSWYHQEAGEASFADFLVYALLNLYRIVDLLDLANQHHVVHLSHVQPIQWPASVLLALFKTFFTCILLEQIFSSVRKGKLLLETINDFFSPHQPIHERARHALPQYGAVALKPLMKFLRAETALTKEQRQELPKIVADIGPAAIPGLVRCLTDPNEQVRAVAVSSLGHLQALEALPNLIALERDPSEIVRLSLAEALGAIVKPGAKSIRKRHWFLAWQTSSSRVNWFWQRQSIVKLGSDPVTFALNHLRRSLTDSSASVRTMVAKTLGGLGKAATLATADLFPLLNDADETVRLQALDALQGIGADPQTTVPALLSLLQDPSPSVRSAAAETLGAFREQVEQIMPALVPLLHDRDETVRQKVAEVVAKTGPLSQESTSSLVEGLTSPDALVRARTAEALGNIGAAAEPAAHALVQAAEDDNDRVRAKAVKALGKIGAGAAQAALPKLLRALRDPDTWVQALAAEALGEMGESADQAIPALTRSLAHPNAQVRYHAAESLGKLGRTAESALPALQNACGDADAGVRAVAICALGEVAPSLAETQVRQACRDADPQVRLAAIAACTPLEVLHEATRHELIGLLEDANDQVKVQAAKVLTKSLGAEPALMTRLVQLLHENHNVWVQTQAASILGNLGPAAASAGPDLAQAATLHEACVREAALKALVQIQPPEGLVAFTIGLQDESADIRKVASAGWRKASAVPEEAVPGLIKALHDPERQVRANAAFALSRVEGLPAESVPLLIECTASPSDEVRLVNAALALFQAPRDDVVVVMEGLLKDPVPRIHLLAAGFVLEVDTHHPLAQHAVTDALTHDSKTLRKAAISLMTSLGPNGLFGLPALRDQLVKENDDRAIADLRRLIAELEGLASTDVQESGPPLAEQGPPVIFARNDVANSAEPAYEPTSGT
jgi:HEAT repeat protein